MTKCDENYDATCAWMECSLMFLNDTGLNLMKWAVEEDSKCIPIYLYLV
ncbi:MULTISPECIES: hypothetical protein [Acinetobacter calcoaceticus/baumannii complex]|jgi:hypothetical protein|nr:MULTISPECIES: hypothetical protein [Acinetobacter calcoaceticus/baumannii complex]MDV7708534.1 hypothetical protein [Acinetobacter pittii]MDV7762830.1 hypothetical protein [Acinetobacter pittii]